MKTKCVDDGPVGAYGGCDSNKDCQAGLECLGGSCKPHCTTVEDCPGDGRLCRQAYSGGEPVDGDLYCTAACDPLDAAACPAGAGCSIFGDGRGGHYADCVSAGTGVGPTGCPESASHGECAPGTACITYTFGKSFGSSCSPICRVGHDGDCASQRCIGYGTPLRVGDIEYGTCAAMCDLVDPAPVCGEGARCTWGDKENPWTDCAGLAAGSSVPATCGKGDPICDPGYGCDGEVCRRYCRIGDAKGCPDGGECVPNTKPALVIGGVTFGWCGDPGPDQ